MVLEAMPRGVLLEGECMTKNKKELSLSEIQNRELRILQYLHEICVENNITYFLFYGTLLGAVRHKGFIPWDDDLDVIVPREDYERLLVILHNQDKYRLLANEYYSDYYYPFAKLVDPETKLVEYGVLECKELGVWVDIFPLDTTPNNPILQKLHVKTVNKLINMNRYISAEEEALKKEMNTVPKKIKYIIAKRFKNNTLINMVNKVAKIYSKKNTKYMGDLLWGSDFDLVFLREWFGKPRQMQFENGLYYIPSDYDSLLKQIYGDYMELPPEEKRHSNHAYSCYMRDE